MEKLKELLMEYSDINHDYYRVYYSDGSFSYCNVSGTDHDLREDEIGMVIKSKEYGFIQRLIDNDKIDIDDYGSYALVGEGENSNYIQLRTDETILMLLSIKDDPIKFLISILK